MGAILARVKTLLMRPKQDNTTSSDVANDDQNTAYPRKCSSCSCSFCMLLRGWCTGLLEKTFRCTGHHIATHPWTTVGACLLLVCICSMGFFRFKTESRTEKLFIPQDSQSIKDLNEGDKYFNMKSRVQSVILEAATGTNVLTSTCLKEALQIHNEVIKLDSYLDLCATKLGKKANTSESCLLLNPLEIFNFEGRNLVEISRKIRNANGSLSWHMRNGKPLVYSTHHLFGGVVYNSTSHEIRARAIQMIYFMRDYENDEEFLKISNFEEKFIKKISWLADHVSCGNIYFSAERSMDDAISENNWSVVHLAAISFSLMIVFSCVMLGRFSNPLNGHSLLACAGVFAVVLGMLVGFSLAILVGVPFINLVGALPFLVVGIGIDDMFIILDELDRQKPQDTVDTVKVVMKSSGATITMTTMTDLVAFAVSTFSSFPAITYFCIFGAFSLTCAYLMMVTFFVAVMTFDIKRIKSGHRDCLPCCRAPRPTEGETPVRDIQPHLRNKAMEHWAKILMMPGMKVVVVLISLGLLGAGIYGITKTDERFDRKLVAKEDSYLLKFVNAQEKYFDMSIAVSVVVTGQISYEDILIQEEIKKLSTIVKENNHYHNNTMSWLSIFTKFARQREINITTNSQFMNALKAFLNIPAFSFHREDIKLSEDEQQIKASRINAAMKSSNSSTFHRDAMMTLREDISSESELQAFPIAKAFIQFEQYVVVSSLTIQNLSIAGLSILVITGFFLMNITVISLVFLGFVAHIIELFGLMYIWGVPLNTVSMINLVMAIGFSVDYSAHVAHVFVKSNKERIDDRVIEALHTVGASVLMGGMSTFIGISLTAFSSSEIFRIFFRMFFGIIVFGLLHGLCFLPVYLSLIPWQLSCPADMTSRVGVIKADENNASTGRDEKKASEMLSTGSMKTLQEELDRQTNDVEMEMKVPDTNGTVSKDSGPEQSTKDPKVDDDVSTKQGNINKTTFETDDTQYTMSDVEVKVTLSRDNRAFETEVIN